MTVSIKEVQQVGSHGGQIFLSSKSSLPSFVTPILEKFYAAPMELVMRP
jgi:hypothetical protein